AIWRGHRICFARSPTALLVKENRCSQVGHGVYDSPGRLDGVLAREQGRVALHRVADQPLVRSQLGCFIVAHVQFDFLAGHDMARSLAACTQCDRDAVRAETKSKVVRLWRHRFAEHLLRRPLEIDDGFGRRHREFFSGADEDRHVGPTPGIQMQLHGSEGFDLRIRRDAFLFAIAGVLPANQTAAAKWAQAAEYFDLLVADRLGTFSDRRLHRDVRNDLQQMILHDIANRPHLFVETAATLYAEGFRHGDLYTLDVVAIPERFEEAVGEAKIEQILHGLLAEVVVDAEYRRFGEDPMHGLVQCTGRSQVAPEGLFHDYPSALRAARCADSLHHGREKTGRNGEVVQGMMTAGKRLAQAGIGRRVAIIAVDIT